MSFYRLDDSGIHETKGLIPISCNELHRWNDDKWGVFFAINEFEGRRLKENLTNIRSWYVDLDKEDKEGLFKRIEQTHLAPSLVVETKNGYHIYWKAHEASEENYAEIQTRLAYNFRAKDCLKDTTRVMRIPGFYHWKDPLNPFLVAKVYSRKVTYSDKMMLAFYPKKPEEGKRVPKPHEEGEDFWEELNVMDCRDGLEQLSGTAWVNYEEYSFRDNSDGTVQIVVDGKATGCWIDEEGYIGSSAEGVYRIHGWLKYFGLTWKDIFKIGKEVFNIEKI